MKPDKKAGRYERIYNQLMDLLNATENPVSRMATIAAVLHNKMDGFFWTGFYILNEGELLVGPYQGPLACQVLEKDKGVCWAGIHQNQTIIVPDVANFPDHIACDSRSRSEIVIPLRNSNNEVLGVLDIDSNNLDQFDNLDASCLERILSLL